MPRSVSQQSKGEGTAPVAFCRNLMGSKTAGVFGQRRALNRVGMAGEIFRHAVHHDVRAQLEGLLEVGRGESVVDDHERAAGVRQLADGGNVVHQQARIGGRFDPDQPRFLVDGRFDRFQVAGVDLPDHHADGLIDLVQNAVRAAVDVERDDDFVAGPQIRLENGVLGRQPRCECRRVFHAFQRRQHFFEPLPRGIVRARVAEAFVLPGRFLLVGGGLKNGSNQRPGFRLRRLAGVNRLRCEFHGVTPFCAIRAREGLCQ